MVYNTEDKAYVQFGIGSTEIQMYTGIKGDTSNKPEVLLAIRNTSKALETHTELNAKHGVDLQLPDIESIDNIIRVFQKAKEVLEKKQKEYAEEKAKECIEQ